VGLWKIEAEVKVEIDATGEALPALRGFLSGPRVMTTMDLLQSVLRDMGIDLVVEMSEWPSII